MKLHDIDAHLTYCTNVHPGESLADVRNGLEHHASRIKARVSPDEPFGVGLRLSARAAEELGAPGQVELLRQWLDHRGLYVFTLNGSPYGAFHGERVKERAYFPDWLEESRFQYTERLATLLASLLPEGELEGSISTVPGAFGRRVQRPDDLALIRERLLRLAAQLNRLRETTGRTILVALEPEPGCVLETSSDAVRFFEDWVFCHAGLRRFASISLLSVAEAETVLRRHLGICLDACHMAVGFEKPVPALDAVRAAGIRIGKIQLSVGLEARPGVPLVETLDMLQSLAEPIYFHQTWMKNGDGVVRWLDLPEAIAAVRLAGALRGPLRVNYRVPIVREMMGPLFTTKAALADLFDSAATRGATRHFEVEIYTWGVMSQEHRRNALSDVISSDLSWAKEQLLR